MVLLGRSPALVREGDLTAVLLVKRQLTGDAVLTQNYRGMRELLSSNLDSIPIPGLRRQPDGRIVYTPPRPRRGRKAPRSTLVKCSLPGCDEILTEAEMAGHLMFHEEPEPEVKQVESSADDEGVYTVTSMGGEEDDDYYQF
jgi:hypothetical protein